MVISWKDASDWDGKEKKVYSRLEYERYFARIEKIVHSENDLEAKIVFCRIADGADGFFVESIYFEKYKTTSESDVNKWIEVEKWKVVERCTSEIKDRLEALIATARGKTSQKTSELNLIKYEMEVAFDKSTRPLSEEEMNEVYKEIGDEHKLTQKEAEVLHMCGTDRLSDIPEVTKVLGKLSKKGLVRQDLNLENVISASVLLSEKGWQIVEKLKDRIYQKKKGENNKM
jgi:DNA-binding MarR family transcriptional regulator